MRNRILILYNKRKEIRLNNLKEKKTEFKDYNNQSKYK